MVEVVAIDALRALAAVLPEEPPKTEASHRGSGELFDVEGWLAEHNIEILYTAPWNGGQKWVLRACVWNQDHQDKSAFVLRFPNGAIAAGCHHNSCQGKRWHDLRDAVEPGWKEAYGNHHQSGEFSSNGSHPNGSIPPRSSY